MAQRYAAFLRGINLGGRRVSGSELAAAFESTDGISAAAPFIASGNVVFEDGTRRKPATIAAAIEAAILESFGWESKVFLRTQAEIAELAALEPFAPQQLDASTGKPQIIFFEEEITKPRAKEAVELAPDGDLLVPRGRELHWLPSGGISDSDLDLKALDRLLGTGTTRTANTVKRLHAKHFAGRRRVFPRLAGIGD
jgi:uncharacterized protein (DUF1697 family)